MSLIKTGLAEALIAQALKALDAVGIETGKVAEPRDAVWDGDSFAPLLGLLAQAADEGRLEPAGMGKFLHVMFSPSLEWSGEAGLAALEKAMESDPFLMTLAAAGVQAKEVLVGVDGGVSFDNHAESVWKAIWSIDTDNAAPDLLTKPEIGLAMTEGGTLTVDSVFADRDGDALRLVIDTDVPGLSVTLDDKGNLIVTASHTTAGVHDLAIRASDGTGLSEVLHLRLDIADSGPGVTTWNSTAMGRMLAQHDSLADALAGVGRSRYLDLHHAGAVEGAGTLTVGAENLSLGGGADLAAALALGAAVRRLTLTGEAAFDVTGNAQANIVQGNAGANVLAGAVGADMIRGGAGNDRIDGGIGRDRLWGEDGDDVIRGGAGDDQMFGGAGDDILRGGAGRDQATGGAGADVFVFAAGDQTLVIRDLAAEDTIRIEGFAGVDDWTDLTISASGPNTRVLIGDHQIVLMGTARDTLTADSFDFV